MQFIVDFPSPDFNDALRRIADLEVAVKGLIHPKAVSATLKIGDSMSAILKVGQTAVSSFKEWSQPNGLGVEVPVTGPVSFASSDPTIASVDAATGLVTAVSASASPVTITATDMGNQLSAKDSASVPFVAISATLVVTAS